MKQNLENVLHNKLEPKDYKTDYYIHLTDEAKAALFTKKAIEFYDVLSERYDLNEISSEKKEFIKVLLFQWLINQDESVIDITTVT